MPPSSPRRPRSGAREGRQNKARQNESVWQNKPKPQNKAKPQNKPKPQIKPKRQIKPRRLPCAALPRPAELPFQKIIVR